jgi:hypothetical protein
MRPSVTLAFRRMGLFYSTVSCNAPQVQSEFKQAADWDRRFHQYYENYNDRAYYSLACVLDGDCPVNFRDQLTVGQV